MKIYREDTAAVVVDMQERLFPHISGHELLERKIISLIKGLQILKIPLIVTQQYTKGLGPTIPGVAEVLNEYQPIEKISFSCCGEPAFMELLKQLEKPFVILLGIEAHVCVLQTALDLLDDQYIPVIIEDGVSSRNMNDKKIAMNRLWNEGALISTSESILFELCGKANTDEFKAISKLIK
jgi:nicotinamidase-related amidase